MSPNRLAGEKSPYLLQHKDNPVDWRPWGDEAFQAAKDLDRPLLLSVGYSTCHWCHVMEKESFSQADVAAVMNAHLICVKLDREERPDVDKIYMTAVQAMTGQGGWPLNVFLTPDLKPFFGGTYYP
ncbi:MAG: thioredoxin domain-containing protein, partial [Elusimicrobia bacterium]|nr:thioredoxin domain-containing protein [Elusimicrobiota bacterium]